MRTTKFVLLSSAIIIIALISVGCGKKDNAPTQPLQKNSSLLLKVSSKSNSNNVLSGSGTISLTSFNVNLSKITLQENTGFEGNQQGQNNDGGNESSGSETESPDITINGPLSFDISSGVVDLGSIEVYAGVFKKVDLSFTPSSNSPFNNSSIIVNGNYTKQNGEVIPFKINSKFSQTFETLIANGGIIVNSNSSVPVTIIFDFGKIFNNIDLSSCTVSNGTIIINEQNNANILAAFEKNLNNSVEVEK
ncbi:Hypothetical protein IALB_0177 [Ignavibacterium album JCM 16511]|uniref:Lipoprotein n=1 Tax=Ignavibacterium album (strain DSM 19864 / JCM 16511 / NBRC 101810 / Mat9-16) TaxID=945713 RepID=I0AFY2_IGNAJ|nr:hypothetical protein [Ignavibacterium album]AFH47889.1 Hypothetical protein IALB_0177 [Ignavibacterium album JCM 16511]